MKKWYIPAFALAVIAFCCAVTISFGYATTGDVEPIESVETTEKPIVDISDESVEAIADAVKATQTSPLVVTNKNGVSFNVPDRVANYWTDEFSLLYVTTGTGYERKEYWFVTNSEIVHIQDYNDSLRLNVGLPYFAITYGHNGTLLGSGGEALDNYNEYNLTDFTIQYSEFDVYFYDSVYYESDVVTPYVVSFETGFPDLKVQDQLSTNLVLPSLNYDGYIFCGWYVDSEHSIRFPDVTEITSDITLYAKWREESPMSFFTDTLFESMTTFFESPPILYLVSLMGLALVIGIFKIFICSRV